MTDDVKISQKAVKISKKEIKKTIDVYNQWEKTIDKWELNGKTVIINNGKICYAEQNGHVLVEGDTELIGRVTWMDEDEKVGTWRWGHTLEDWGDKTTPKDDYKHAALKDIPNQVVFAAGDIVIFTLLRVVADKQKYDFVHLVRLGPDESTKYVFGIKHLHRCTHETSTASIIPAETVSQFGTDVSAKTTDLTSGLQLVQMQ